MNASSKTCQDYSANTVPKWCRIHSVLRRFLVVKQHHPKVEIHLSDIDSGLVPYILNHLVGSTPYLARDVMDTNATTESGMNPPSHPTVFITPSDAPNDPCLSCPPRLPGWALGLILVLLVLLGCSVAYNALLIYRRRRLQRDLAIKAWNNMDTQKPTGSTANNNGSHGVAGKDNNGPLLRTKTMLALKKGRIEIPRENIGITVSLRAIGSGDFGQVWKGEARGLTASGGHVIPVAAREMPGSWSDADILETCTPLWRLKTHENVVQLYGCCLETEPSYILTEYVTGGTLLTFLRTHGAVAGGHTASYYANLETINQVDHAITGMEKSLYIFDIVNGMDYLASQNIIHGNLCAHNILMTKEKRCKVTDFGVTPHSTSAKGARTSGTWRWHSPERLGGAPCSSAADVWSFGVVVWEIMTHGKLPYSELEEREIRDRVMEGYRLPDPDNCEDSTINLMRECWGDDVNARPKFVVIKDRFGAKLEEEADYFALGSGVESYYACVDIIES